MVPPPPLKADIGPIIIVVLFCIFASSIRKVQNIHKPGPWVLKLRKTEIGKLLPIYPLRPTFKVDFCKILCSEAMGAGSLTPGDEPAPGTVGSPMKKRASNLSSTRVACLDPSTS